GDAVHDDADTFHEFPPKAAFSRKPLPSNMAICNHLVICGREGCDLSRCFWQENHMPWRWPE
ncbi:hypothetical protein, partial [Agrobacterium sp.]|uniref:hypothetical protein n=1 Tax=Agrobacterium sp. TaxID=361 RepID=UPI004033C5B7